MNNMPIAYFPTKEEISTFHFLAQTAAQSGLYSGIGGDQKILMIILAAREMGIPIFQALNGGIWNIQGKVELSPRLMASMIRRAGHSIDIKVLDENECVLVGTRKDNGDTHTAKFSLEDAKAAGLTGKGVWKSYAEDMLYARAMSRLGRRLFADVIGTSYVQGEISDAKTEKKESKVEILQTDFEEIKAPCEVDPTAIESLKCLFDLCDDEYKKKMENWLATKKISLDFANITQKLYDSMKKSVDAHLAEKYEDKAIGES